jgi:1,4-alpha-glucan branching enzyme
VKLVKEKQDEDWPMQDMVSMLFNRRADEKTVAYVESHDQALVGDQTLAFRLMGADMYSSMAITTPSLVVDRGIALLKLIRLITASFGGEAYLNFMGNEFGHPDWIDFPRDGNGWSHKYARRQWSLADAPYLRYHFLQDFDRAMLKTITQFGLLNLLPGHCLLVNEADKVIALERGGLVFVYNFHPVKSYTDYAIPVFEHGKFMAVLDTDRPAFGGFGRLKAETEYFTTDEKQLRLYLPSRAALVLENKG